MEADNDQVICPKCVHQFVAIPVNVQQVIRSLEAENAKLRDINKMLDSALCRAYPNGCYHGDVFDLWNAARAALGENK